MSNTHLQVTTSDTSISKDLAMHNINKYLLIKFIVVLVKCLQIPLSRVSIVLVVCRIKSRDCTQCPPLLTKSLHSVFILPFSFYWFLYFGSRYDRNDLIWSNQRWGAAACAVLITAVREVFQIALVSGSGLIKGSGLVVHSLRHCI